MIIKKLRLVSILCLICLLVLFIVWPLQTFVAFVLGVLIAPPIFVFTSVLMEGIPIVSKELENVFSSVKEILKISISKKSIILESEFR